MGIGRGRQKYAFLPYPESDFIFAVVGEDLGLIGCLGVTPILIVIAAAVIALVADSICKTNAAKKEGGTDDGSHS